MGGEHYLEELRRIAEANGGKLLSTEWVGSNGKYCFAFDDGRTFSIFISNLKRRGWPKDPDKYFRTHNKDRGSIHLDELRRIAEANGGRLLSTEWKGTHVRHRFIFADGREFETTPASIRGRQGWPKDPDVYFRSHANQERGVILLDEMRRIANERGGKLLSTEWTGSKCKYLFQDQAGLEFLMSHSNLRNGCWSPHAGLISEPVCRQVMEHLFGVPFPSSWNIIQPHRKRPLQFDGYAKNVHLPHGTQDIAFEYQGNQDHRINQKVIARDLEKVSFCKANDIILVVIEPFRSKNTWESNYVVEHVRQAVTRAFKLAGIDLPRLNNDVFNVDIQKQHRAVNRLNELKQIAESNGGQLLSIEEWKGDKASYDFAFPDGRNFSMSAADLKRRGWPKDPDKYLRYSKRRGAIHLNELRDIAEANGGRLLSAEWRGNTAKYRFAFADGREFETTAASIKYGWPKSPDRYFKHIETLTKMQAPEVRP